MDSKGPNEEESILLLPTPLAFSLVLLLTCHSHVDERIVDQHQLVKVELVSETFPFGLVQDPLVVVVPGGGGGGEGRGGQTQGQSVADESPSGSEETVVGGLWCLEGRDAKPGGLEGESSQT